MSAIVIRGDARHLPLPDGSVDLVVTSPPYFALRSYTDNGGQHYTGQVGSEPTPREFLEALWAVTAECVRVLKPGGSIFVNLGDKYAGSGGHNNGGIAKPDKKRPGLWEADGPMRITNEHRAARRNAPDRYNQNSDGIRPKSLMGLPWRYAIGCIDQLGLILRAEVVWSKPNGLPESVTDRVRRSHEQWFHLVREPRYYAAVDELREAYSARTLEQEEIDRRSGAIKTTFNAPHDFGVQAARSVTKVSPLGALPGSVQTVATEPLSVPSHLGDHFAAFPSWWPWWLIKGWSPPGGTILDPFGGTGTTAMMADALGRHGVSVDLSADYCRLADWRIFESGQGPRLLAKHEGHRPVVGLPQRSHPTLFGAVL